MPSRTLLTSLLAVAALALLAAPASAQLRPLDPIGWTTLDRPGGVFLVGGAVHEEQRISLAGAEGRLFEFGVFQATWSYERVAIRLAGTLFRFFDSQRVFAEPVADTRPPDDSYREDAGDIRASTIVWLTDPHSRVGAAFRFGTRLPTTDNKEGLGRDQADFFTTLGLRYLTGNLDLSVEAGAGVNGTRDPENEQVDPVLYAATFRYESGTVDPFLELTGQSDPRKNRDRRGNENIGEARLGVEVGNDRRWMKVWIERGWTPFSPDVGLTLLYGTRFGGG